MRKSIVLLSLLLLSAVSCAPGIYIQSRDYATSGNNGNSRVKGVAFWENYPELTIARAKLIESEANLNNARAEQIRKGERIKQFRCWIRNVGRGYLTVINPETNEQIDIAPGDIAIFDTRHVHKSILARRSGHTRFRSTKLFPGPMVINEIKIDYGANIG